MISGKVRVTTVDEDHQEVIVDEPGEGQFFGFASMLEQTPHQTMPSHSTETVCLEVSRDDIAVLLQRSRLREWICSRPWAVSSTRRRNWYGSARLHRLFQPLRHALRIPRPCVARLTVKFGVGLRMRKRAGSQ